MDKIERDKFKEEVLAAKAISWKSDLSDEQRTWIANYETSLMSTPTISAAGKAVTLCSLSIMGYGGWWRKQWKQALIATAILQTVRPPLLYMRRRECRAHFIELGGLEQFERDFPACDLKNVQRQMMLSRPFLIADAIDPANPTEGEIESLKRNIVYQYETDKEAAIAADKKAADALERQYERAKNSWTVIK